MRATAAAVSAMALLPSATRSLLPSPSRHQKPPGRWSPATLFDLGRTEDKAALAAPPPPMIGDDLHSSEVVASTLQEPAAASTERKKAQREEWLNRSILGYRLRLEERNQRRREGRRRGSKGEERTSLSLKEKKAEPVQISLLSYRTHLEEGGGELLSPGTASRAAFSPSATDGPQEARRRIEAWIKAEADFHHRSETSLHRTAASTLVAREAADVRGLAVRAAEERLMKEEREKKRRLEGWGDLMGTSSGRVTEKTAEAEKDPVIEVGRGLDLRDLIRRRKPYKVKDAKPVRIKDSSAAANFLEVISTPDLKGAVCRDDTITAATTLMPLAPPRRVAQMSVGIRGGRWSNSSALGNVLKQQRTVVMVAVALVVGRRLLMMFAGRSMIS